MKPGILFADPHGQTAKLLTGALGPVEDRVVYLDFASKSPVVAFNAFAGVAVDDDLGDLAANFVQIFGSILGTEGFKRIEHFLYNGLYGLFAIGRNLATLEVLFSPSTEGAALRSQIIAAVRHEPVRRFFLEEYKTHSLGEFAPIQNRFSRLFDEQAYRLFNQHENKVDFSSFMEHGKIVIVALPSNWESARILGGFIIGLIKHLAMRRPVTAPKFFLMVDEFPRFGGAAFHEILDQTTKGRLSLWLAHQTTSQVPSELSKTIQGIDTFVFGVNPSDAKLYSGIFGEKVSAKTLNTLKIGSVYARLGGDDVVNFESPRPLVFDPLVAARVLAASHSRYYSVPAPVVLPRRSREIETI